jgi:hypothetical protein
MKLNVKIEFDIDGDEALSDEDLKEMIYTYLAEAIELEELDYSVENLDINEMN